MATQQTKDGLGYIIQAISNIVEPKMETLKYDKTYRAKVTQKIDAGVYNVQINGTSYKLSYSGTLNVGDIVRVKAPLNNFSDIYIETLPSSSGGGTGGTTNYNDLTNKPIINSTYSTSQSTNASEILKGTIALHKISKTGNYNDLNNKPSLNFIPISDKGESNGVATLDTNKKITTSQIPIATKTSLGAVKIGSNLTITSDGVLSATGGGASSNEVEISNSHPTEDTVELWVDLSEDGSEEDYNITNQLLEKVYPVGSIYISTNSVSPQVFLGGTWEPFAYGKTLVGVDSSETNPDADFSTSLKTGGEKSHTLTVAEMPSHDHKLYLKSTQVQTVTSSGVWVAQYNGLEQDIYSLLTGGNEAHNNMPPYITVYMWRRIS